MIGNWISSGRQPAVGLTFSVCRAYSLPREPHDRPVDIIIDERRVTIPHGSRNESPRGIPR